MIDPWWACFTATAAATSVALWAADLLLQLLATSSAYAATAVIAYHEASAASGGRGTAGRSGR